MTKSNSTRKRVPLIERIGEKHHHLTVIGAIGGPRGRCVARCVCGNETEQDYYLLKSGKKKSCGCLQKKDLLGRRYGRLVVVDKAEKHKGRIHWICECDCGNKKSVSQNGLRFGQARSCGCLAMESVTRMGKTIKIKHGGSGKGWYVSYRAMVERCENPKNASYLKYGAAGIKVCEYWRKDPLNFYSDMGDRPEGMTLDRIDNNKGYSVDNCRWATMETQSRNRKNTQMNVELALKLRALKKEGMTIGEICKRVPEVSRGAIKGVISGKTWKNI